MVLTPSSSEEPGSETAPADSVVAEGEWKLNAEESLLTYNATRLTGKGHTGTVDIKEGGAAVIVAENIRIQEGGGGVLLAKQAEISDGGVLFLAAREVSGNATIIFDLKAAVVFGLIAGLTISLYKLIAGRS